jgi:hypothetical protein
MLKKVAYSFLTIFIYMYLTVLFFSHWWRTGKKWYGAPEKTHPLDLLLQLTSLLQRYAGCYLPFLPLSLSSPCDAGSHLLVQNSLSKGDIHVWIYLKVILCFGYVEQRDDMG